MKLVECVSLETPAETLKDSNFNLVKFTTFVCLIAAQNHYLSLLFSSVLSCSLPSFQMSRLSGRQYFPVSDLKQTNLLEFV